MKTTLAVSTLVVFALLASVRSSQASPVTTYNTTIGISGSTPYVVSNTDLLQTGALASTSSTGTFSKFGPDGGLAVLTDGQFATAGGNFPQATFADGTNTLTYVFNNPLGGGYNITNINTYAGWDAFRGGQSYTVSYDTVSNPGIYTPIATVLTDPSGTANTSTSVLNSDTTGVLAADVHSLLFSFASNLNQGAAAYREIDVFGHAIPEPSTFILCGFGAVGLLVAARRRNA